ncbi:MAG: sigma-54 dependent transcriptional regulator [Thiohalophilus sp.]|uniref:sigma-54-dependent transcriptional regulator n=1 Tax=Thiohalophilus sp. TaxID=3028392 RepID=UPI00286FF80A|nr:sigma-54 dependent transcriptional regulator [Thiohalophilus sp.]MDR9436841.1 sigma-54 dependent transcriptional regulator [Thiohalophilus sp.]
MKPAALMEVSILVVDDEPGMRNFMQRVLQKQYGLVEVAADIAEAEQLRQRCHFDVIIIDNRLPKSSGAEWLQQIRKHDLDTHVILITGYADMDVAISAVRGGASDFLTKPFRAEDIKQSISRCLLQRDRARSDFANQTSVQDDQETRAVEVIGEAAAIRELEQLVRRIAPTQSTVLIQGETGTGKELVAEAIHRQSGRSGPFVPVNCGSIAADLLESELFGHAKGAFTGAQSARQGLCYFADGGTLFLDEIGEMPLAMQAKLLRMLETHSVRPVGTERELKVDCRILAATNRNLEELVKNNQFREDLYYRLNVVALKVPALRERLSDIPALTRHFVHKLAGELGLPAYPLSQQDIRQLQKYDWPGNVRELRNVIERTLLLGKLPTELLAANNASDRETKDFLVPDGWTLRDVEQRYLLDMLACVEGNKSEAARRLGISRKTIERKLSEWQSDSRQYI